MAGSAPRGGRRRSPGSRRQGPPGLQRVTLGRVDVDSGQLLVIDPCYLDGWRRHSEASAIAVDVWGASEKEAVASLRGHPAVGEIKQNAGGTWRYTPAEPHSVFDLAVAIQNAVAQNSWVVVCHIVTDSSYQQVCDLTMGAPANKQGGEVGLGVAFHSGFGDGVYSVTATIKDFGSAGRRITKVEIDLLGDEDDG